MKRVYACLAVIIAITGVAVRTAHASFADSKISAGNSFASSLLDFNLAASQFDPQQASINFYSGATTNKTINVDLAASSTGMTYFASTTNMTGDMPFCSQLSVDASLNGNLFSSGSLINFKSATTTDNSTTTSDIWKFAISSASSLPDSSCSFNFEYTGRQANPYLAAAGFSHSESASSTISSSGFRINKIYDNVAPDRGSANANEWVEIYNQTDTVLDLAGWQICSNQECTAIAASSTTSIPAEGFAVVTASSTTWNYWDPESKVVHIVSDNPVHDLIANPDSTLVLKRPDGAVIDQVVDAPVPNGDILARKSNGYDTDEASDFIDLAPPTVNLAYPDQSGALIWYWGFTYDITWTASNPGGSNDDLKAGITFIKDIDGTQTITTPDEPLAIVMNAPNTGIYTWTVPFGFLGYTWVKLMITNPQDPMLSAEAVSGKIYDPPSFQSLMNSEPPVPNDATTSTTTIITQ